MRDLMHNYAALNPDLSSKEREEHKTKSDFLNFKETLQTVLDRGNYS